MQYGWLGSMVTAYLLHVPPLGSKIGPEWVFHYICISFADGWNYSWGFSSCENSSPYPFWCPLRLGIFFLYRCDYQTGYRSGSDLIGWSFPTCQTELEKGGWIQIPFLTRCRFPLRLGIFILYRCGLPTWLPLRRLFDRLVCPTCQTELE